MGGSDSQLCWLQRQTAASHQPTGRTWHRVARGRAHLYGLKNLDTLERSNRMKDLGNISRDSWAVYLK